MTLRATSMLKDLDTGEMTDLEILFFIPTSVLSLSLSFTHTHTHTPHSILRKRGKCLSHPQAAGSLEKPTRDGEAFWGSSWAHLSSWA